jgi:hypothetical protein
MLEVIAMVLFVVWVMSLVTGSSLGASAHVFLAGSIVAYVLHRREEWKSASGTRPSPAQILSHLLGRRVAPSAPAEPRGAGKARQARSNPGAVA